MIAISYLEMPRYARYLPKQKTSESFRGLGQKLSDLELKPNILLSCINRRGKIIIPSGNDAIEKGDTVIVVTTADRFINDLNDILDEEKGLL